MKIKKLNDKGSTIVIVMIAMSIVATLAVIALWISLANYQMKTTNIKVKDNFYSAESVLNQIRTGLQGDVSEAYNEALTEVFEKYALLDEKQRKEHFDNKYVNTLRTRIKSSSSDLNYDIDKIRAFVDPALFAANAKPSAVIETTSATDGKNGLLNVYKDGISLKGIKVTFTDEKGYVSVIETDIFIKIPDVDLTMSEDLPDLFSYGIIANGQIFLGHDGAKNKTFTVHGNVYAGTPSDMNSNYWNGVGDSESSFASQANTSVFELKDCEYFINKGNISLGKGIEMKLPAGCQFWANNVTLSGLDSKLYSLGNTYIADDLSLNGENSVAVLGSNKSGKYVGFGNQKDTADRNSAIVLNAKNTTVDMTNLSEIFIGGNAYISTSSIASVNNRPQNNDIQTGQSIAIKGNQLSFLVPAECIGTIGDGPEAKSFYGKNPIAFYQYDNLVDEKNNYTLVNTNIVSKKLGHSLSYYLEEGQTIDDVLTVVFENSWPTRTYLYMNLSPEKAALYYQDYYKQNSSKLQAYSSFYTNNLKMSEDSVVHTAGDYSLYENGNLSLMKGIVDDVDINAECAVTTKMHTALTKKLIKNYNALTTEELSNNIFYNLIDEVKLKQAFEKYNPSNNVLTFKTTINGVEYSAVVHNGGEYQFNAPDTERKKIRLIISTGNVRVTHDFNGTIISGGITYLHAVNYPSITVAAASEDVFKGLFSASLDPSDPDSLKLYELFKEGSAYMSNGMAGVNGGETNLDTQFIQYSDVITYQNWTKK